MDWNQIFIETILIPQHPSVKRALKIPLSFPFCNSTTRIANLFKMRISITGALLSTWVEKAGDEKRYRSRFKALLLPYE